VGDAAGAPLEFDYQPSMEEAKHAMTMPGGDGVWGVASGQITDDSELALCLAQALGSHLDFNLEQIAQNYAKWIDSPPFDIGFTTRASLGCLREPKWRSVCEAEGYAVAMTRAARQRCMESKSNGSLMRIAIQETLHGGGDTDTNACIVGGLIGAACGASAIPDEMKLAVLHCDTHQGKHPRPSFLHTTQVPELTKRLLGLS